VENTRPNILDRLSCNRGKTSNNHRAEVNKKKNHKCTSVFDNDLNIGLNNGGTLIPGLLRKELKEIMPIVTRIDPNAFYTMQQEGWVIR
jgi:hypothetical protein